MIQLSTHNLLLLYLYGETSATQTAFIEAELQTNEALKAEYQSLLETKELLAGNRLSPSRSSVNIILQHSKETETLHQTE